MALKSTRNPDLLNFAGMKDAPGPGKKLLVRLDQPVQTGVDSEGGPVWKFHDEVFVPAAAFNADINGSSAALENANGGVPFSFKIHSRKIPGVTPVKWETVIGTRPADGAWPSDTAEVS